MTKYSEKLVAKIVKLIEADNYTISEICDTFAINRKRENKMRKKQIPATSLFTIALQNE